MGTIDYSIVIPFVLGGIALMVQRFIKISDIVGFAFIIAGISVFFINHKVFQHIKNKWGFPDYALIIGLLLLALIIGLVCYNFLKSRHEHSVKELNNRIKDKNAEITSLGQKLEHKDVTSENKFLSIRAIGDQVFNTISGKVLVEKWGITSQTLLEIVKKSLIDAYAPDKDKVINNEPEKFEVTIGFYGKENEIDEDAVLRFRFRPKDIARFEMIAEQYKTTT